MYSKAPFLLCPVELWFICCLKITKICFFLIYVTVLISLKLPYSSLTQFSVWTRPRAFTRYISKIRIYRQLTVVAYDSIRAYVKLGEAKFKEAEELAVLFAK